ncbi:MAG: hypothetical protein ACR2RV_13540 [Verrucomicrobiales bacterium]
MKLPSQILLAVLCLCVFPSPCLALLSFGYVSKQKAEAEGMEIRWQPAGPEGVWVEFSFKTEGRLEEFNQPQRHNYVDLRVGGSEENAYLVRAALREDRTKKGRVTVRFTAERAKLHKIELWIIRYLTGVADVVRMGDFIALDQIDPSEGRDSEPAAGVDASPAEEDGGGAPPAAAAAEAPAPDEEN